MELTAHSSVAAERSVATIMGQVLTLVAAAIGLCALGTYLGRDLSFETARIFSFAGLGMLIVQCFVTRAALRRARHLLARRRRRADRLRPRPGHRLLRRDPARARSPAPPSLTAATVAGMGALGFAWSKDTVGWMRPLSFIVLGCVVISIGAMLFGGLGALSPVLSLVILVASALLILVDFNYVRKHATEDDVVWLATGIFVSILNIFLSAAEHPAQLGDVSTRVTCSECRGEATAIRARSHRRTGDRAVRAVLGESSCLRLPAPRPAAASLGAQRAIPDTETPCRRRGQSRRADAQALGRRDRRGAGRSAGCRVPDVRRPTRRLSRRSATRSCSACRSAAVRATPSFPQRPQAGRSRRSPSAATAERDRISGVAVTMTLSR